MSRHVQVVVTLGGMFEMDIDDSTLAEDVIAAAAKEWSIDMSELKEPFVVTSNMFGQTHSLMKQEPVVTKLGAADGSMLRAVMPLKPKE